MGIIFPIHLPVRKWIVLANYLFKGPVKTFDSCVCIVLQGWWGIIPMRTRDVARQRAIERKEPMELARQLRAKREERGLSQDEVSKAIFVSRQTISNWENDKTYPDVQSLLLLSQLFEVSIDELVRGDVVAMQQAIAEDSRILLAGLLLALEG